jgi:FAD binding domain
MYARLWRVGLARGSRSTGPHWDPSGRRRWGTTSSTFGLQPMWPGRLRRCLAVTLGPSARSDGFYPPRHLLDRVSSFDELLVNTVRRVGCRRWFSGRLVLLGDAAHAMAPNLSAGANSALVDGVVLAEELAGAQSVIYALAGSDKRRRPLARRLQMTAELLQRLCGIERVTTLHIGRSAGRIGPVPSAQRGGHPSDPGRRGPNCQIGIPARRHLLSRPSPEKSFGSMPVAPVANLENHGSSVWGARRVGTQVTSEPLTGTAFPGGVYHTLRADELPYTGDPEDRPERAVGYLCPG